MIYRGEGKQWARLYKQVGDIYEDMYITQWWQMVRHDGTLVNIGYFTQTVYRSIAIIARQKKEYNMSKKEKATMKYFEKRDDMITRIKKHNGECT